MKLDRRKTFARLLICAAILLTFGRSLAADFVLWDDSTLIFRNPNLNPPTAAGLSHHWRPADPSNDGMYDPLVFTFWWSIAHAAQLNTPDPIGATLNPMIFHAANLIVHCVSACLALEILLRLGFAFVPALLASLLFAIHPLQTEPVVWATGMKDLLSNALALATILQYLIWLKTPTHAREHFLLATLFFILALLAKPSVVTVPLIVMVLARLFFGKTFKQSLIDLWPWFLLAAATTAVAFHTQTNVQLPPTPWWSHPLVAADALAFYLAKLAIPFHLNFDYGRNPTALLTLPRWRHALDWTWTLPAIVALLIWRSRRRPLIAAGIVFVLGLLPVLGLHPFVYQYFSTVADRYIYLSMLAVAIAAAWFLERFARRAILAAAVGLLAIFAGLSFAQAGVWHDSDSLYLRGMALNPDNANHLLALAIYRDLQADNAAARGDSAAEHDLREKAVEFRRRSIELMPLNPFTYHPLAEDLVRLGRADEAVDVVRQWVAIQPQMHDYERSDPAALHHELGVRLIQANRFPEAMTELQTSVRIKPDPQVTREIQELSDRMK